jgi:hypothetical protein
VQPDAKVARILARFEPVEWLYDGLNGKVVQWTLAQGNTNHDPSILAFVVGRDGKVFASLMDGKQYQAGAFAGWLEEQADAYERQHPSTRLPFVRPKVSVRGEGADARAACADLDEARAAKKPVLLYFGRGSFAEDDKRGKKENKLARKLEKGTLDSKAAEKECAGWVLLRFDLADEAHAVLARGLGVDAAPALLLWAPASEAPDVLDKGISGAGLATLLKKHGPP